MSPLTGGIAAIIAIASVSAGKYAAVSVALDDAVAKIAPQLEQMSDELVLSYLADEVVAEFQQKGKAVNWPEGVQPEFAETEAEYPADVWAEAKARWDHNGSEWQAQYRDYQIQKRAYEFQAVVGQARGEGFIASFSLFDVLFFGLAVMTAFGVASGAGGE